MYKENSYFNEEDTYLFEDYRGQFESKVYLAKKTDEDKGHYYTVENRWGGQVSVTCLKVIE